MRNWSWLLPVILGNLCLVKAIFYTNSSSGTYVTTNGTYFAGLVNYLDRNYFPKSGCNDLQACGSSVTNVSDRKIFLSNEIISLGYLLTLNVKSTSSSDPVIVCLTIYDAAGDGINNDYEWYTPVLGYIDSVNGGQFMLCFSSTWTGRKQFFLEIIYFWRSSTFQSELCQLHILLCCQHSDVCSFRFPLYDVLSMCQSMH
jgi:hypothetical protein